MKSRSPWNLPGQELGWPCNGTPGWRLLIPTSLGRFGRRVYPPRRPTPLIVHWGTLYVSSRGIYRLMWCGRWIPQSPDAPSMFESVTCEGCRDARNLYGSPLRSGFYLPSPEDD